MRRRKPRKPRRRGQNPRRPQLLATWSAPKQAPVGGRPSATEPTVAAVPPSVLASSIAPTEIASLLQVHLKRVGCDPGCFLSTRARTIQQTLPHSLRYRDGGPGCPFCCPREDRTRLPANM